MSVHCGLIVACASRRVVAPSNGFLLRFFREESDEHAIREEWHHALQTNSQDFMVRDAFGFLYAFYVCMYACMFVWKYVCMYACMFKYVGKHVCEHACKHACVHVHVCMHVCMYACCMCVLERMHEECTLMCVGNGWRWCAVPAGERVGNDDHLAVLYRLALGAALCSLLCHFFKSVYLAMHWSNSHDNMTTMVWQTVLVMNSFSSRVPAHALGRARNSRRSIHRSSLNKNPLRFRL